MMKNLFENWRTFIKEENVNQPQMMGPEQLPDNVGVLINTENSPDQISISYINMNDATTSNEPRGEVLIGTVNGEHREWFGSCMGAWVVVGGQVDEQWSSILYEAAIDWASMRDAGVGLAPDRSVVSDFAYSVWEEFAKRQDVQKSQLDDLDGNLGLDEMEICAQNAAISAAGKRGIEWYETPLAFVYWKKDPTMIRQLQQAGKLVFIEFEEA